MKRKKVIFILFILVAFAQLYIPVKMVLDREDVLKSGTEYRFRTTPIDPNDPFRGKYVSLSFVDNRVTVDSLRKWMNGETVYLLFVVDKNGYAKIDTVLKDKPVDSSCFLKTEVSYVMRDSITKLAIVYPFNRYYMDEFKAKEAEVVYSESLVDTAQIAYALVNIKDGDAVLKDVMIDGVSIKEIAEDRLENER